MFWSGNIMVMCGIANPAMAVQVCPRPIDTYSNYLTNTHIYESLTLFICYNGF